MKSIRYEGVSFNISMVKSFNTCDEFIIGHDDLWPDINATRRIARLTELYNLVHENSI